jgi:hypothetical protein
VPANNVSQGRIGRLRLFDQIPRIEEDVFVRRCNDEAPPRCETKIGHYGWAAFLKMPDVQGLEETIVAIEVANPQVPTCSVANWKVSNAVDWRDTIGEPRGRTDLLGRITRRELGTHSRADLKLYELNWGWRHCGEGGRMMSGSLEREAEWEVMSSLGYESPETASFPRTPNGL